MPDDDLRKRAEHWLSNDPDPVTREELRALLQGGDIERSDLADRFASSLDFGTAGLRGVIGAGPNRINRAVVARATWALAQELLARVPGAAQRGVVVGADARRMSPEFAEDVACILAAAGLRVVLFAHPVPTPLVGFSVKRLRAAAGVVITASHNPAAYNGYKVYWENAAQIVPPVDAWIAAAISRAPAAREVARPPLDSLRAQGAVCSPPADIEEQYLSAIATLSAHPRVGDRTFRIVYTPLHGVGDSLARRALAAAGFSGVVSVPEQQRPDGRFPTVAFPNPEEPGAMDLALALARTTGAALVLANDPDADRLAVAFRAEAEPSAPGEPGTTLAADYVSLSGNELGALLGWYLLTERPVVRPRAVVASIVSSPLVGRIAASLGVHYEETLTGFKWIAARAIELERQGYEFVLGFEEAIGYAIGDVVFDKDGISAALLVSEIVAVLAARGTTPLRELEAIAKQFGAFASLQRSMTRPGTRGMAEIEAMMAGLRAAPPSAIGEERVSSLSDYQSGVKVTLASGERRSLGLPPSNVLAFDLAGGARVVGRPSGTEPKAKFYVDVREEVRPSESVARASERARERAVRLANAFMAIVTGAR